MARTPILALAALLCGSASGASAQTDPIRIGVLNDQSGVFASLAGPGSVVAARLAVEDFGSEVLGRRVEVIVADHQNKTDVGAQIARRWYDTENVAAILDVPNSAIALAVQQISRERNKVLLISTSGTSALTGKACSAMSVQWTWDTYGQSVAAAKALIERDGRTWFFLTADFAFGHAMENDATAMIRKLGGQVLGSAKHPLDTPDFASFLLHAQQSGAKVVALANGGTDLITSIKQAHEFGLARGGQKIAALALFLTDVHAVGLESAQGLYFADSFYWDQNDEARAWSKRFFDRQGAMPTSMQAGVYSAVLHFLKAVKAGGSVDGPASMKAMKAMKVNDVFAKNGYIRDDGRMVHDMVMVEVKKPGESRYPWDYYKIVQSVPGDQIVRPVEESECPLLKK